MEDYPVGFEHGVIKFKIPQRSGEPFECTVDWSSMEAMLTRYDEILEDRPNLTDDRKEFMRVTELIALQQAGAEDAEGDPYRATRYKRVLRSVLRRRSSQKG